MKKFLLKIIIPLFVCISIYMVGMEIYLRSLPNDFKYKNDYLEDNANRLKILILGSSNSSMGINPLFFTKQLAFNAAYAAQSLDYDDWIYGKFYDQFDSLEYIIMDMNYRILWHENSPTGVSPTYCKKYAIYYGCDYYSGFDNNFEVSANPIDIYKNIFRKDNRISFTTTDSLGFQDKYYDKVEYDSVQWKEYSKWAVDFYDRDKVNDAERIYKNNIDHIRNLISKAEKKGVTVVFVTFPVHRFFREEVNRDQLKDMRSTVYSFEKEHNNVIYLDFFDSDLLEDADYFNIDHINPKGAEKFTRYLDSLLLDMEHQRDSL